MTVVTSRSPHSPQQQQTQLQRQSVSVMNTTSVSSNVCGVNQLLVVILLFPIVSFITINSYSTIIFDNNVMTGVSNVVNNNNELLNQFLGKQGTNTSNNGSDNNNKPKLPTSTLAGLSCTEHGGPSDSIASEMVYWEDIPSDALYKSPLKHPTIEQYITFEPDPGGWNNIRMAMETVVAMAFAMGRTLVLPPELEFYLLKASKHAGHGAEQNNTFTFEHFFHMEDIEVEHKNGAGIRIISMKEYLQKVALTGQLHDVNTGEVSYPPQNKRIDWDGAPDVDVLFHWLRTVAHVPPHWVPETCLAVFPQSRSKDDINTLLSIQDEILKGPLPKFEDYIDKPVPINGTTIERMKENWAGRERLCIYDEKLQNEQYIHFPVDGKSDTRLLTHFYTFLFFQSYYDDLWMKRFIRDHVRYMDEIQCAAARVIGKVRERAKRRDPIHNPTGIYDAIHVRRGDFQYKSTRIECKEILKMIQSKIPVGTSLFIATDERDKTYFRPLMDQYHVMFLDEFVNDELATMNSNYFGMIDALVTTRSRTFFGCWFSTFTGYINRIRGYHTDKDKLPGYERGLINSYYYVLPDRYDHLQHYYPIKQMFYAREFPTAWRLIDMTVPE